MSRIAACVAAMVVLRTTVVLIQPTVSPEGVGAMSQVKGAYLSGRVVTADRRSRLARTRVQLVSSSAVAFTSSALTSGTGEFVFGDVQPGRYWVRADRTGWQSTFWGQSAPEDEARSLVLEAGERRDDLEITLSRLAVVVGRVIDEYGEPIEGAVVTLKGADLEVARTNDIGEFRIPRIQLGRYVVSASASITDFTAIGSGPQHGVSASVPVEITSSGELSVGELSIVSAANPRQVRGRALRPSGLPAANASVMLLQEESGTRHSISAARAAVTTSSNGDFAFIRIDDGRYRVKATHEMETGFADIVVAGNDLEGVTVLLQTATQMSGALRVESGFDCRNPIVRALPIDAAEADDRAPLEVSVTQGRFSLPPVIGKQQLEVRCGEGQALEVYGIALENGRRISGSVLDTAQMPEHVQITVSARPLVNRVSGTVVDALNRPGDGLVVLVAGDVNRWRSPFQYVWVDRVSGGAFSIRGLPRGRYHVIHEPPKRLGELQSPQYLQKVIARRAQTIEVQDNTDLKISLRIP